ncbi:MAG TPA: hypothetical protein VG891_13515 [Rhizomicrobium sp.]|nr:hypothetical protein [Rhizomicrobium sp.]
MPAKKGGEIYFEFTTQGSVLKATAIDPATGTEVSVVGPANPAARAALKTAAVRKLEFVLRKKRGET